MCGRIEVPKPDDSPEALAKLYRELQERRKQKIPDFAMKRGELRPGDLAAVMAPDRQHRPGIFPMRWGFLLPRQEAAPTMVQLRMEDVLPQEQSTPKGKLVFNARSESAGSKPLFADSMRRRRCLIPAAGYYEWDHTGGSGEKYLFSLPDAEPLWLAGLYRLRDGIQPEFTVLTRPAEGGTEAFHDRMPLILPQSLTEEWLNAPAPDALMRQAVTRLRWTRA